MDFLRVPPIILPILVRTVVALALQDLAGGQPFDEPLLIGEGEIYLDDGGRRLLPIGNTSATDLQKNPIPL